MKFIPLINSGKQVIVDDQDYAYLSQFKWYIHNGYARRCDATQKHGWLQLQNDLLKPQGSFVVDHRNNNRLDNRRGNLRVASRSENQANRQLQSNNKSGYRGVFWSKQNKKWVSTITASRRTKYIGTSHDPIELARKYNAVAKSIFGEFARMNEV